VCRTTKPLISLAFKAMRQRIPVKILGREIGQGLKTLIGKMRANDVDDLVVKLEAWAAREIDKAIAKQLDAKVDQLQDKLDAILCLVDGLPETARTIPDLLECIEGLFNNNVQALTLSTIHKAKGMEADRVWWLNSSLCPSKWAKQDWQKTQEINLCYVAITRAKTALLYIEDGSGKKGQEREEFDAAEEEAAEQARYANMPRSELPEAV
jgi:superfamily I DNA/RNA helicase